MYQSSFMKLLSFSFAVAILAISLKVAGHQSSGNNPSLIHNSDDSIEIAVKPQIVFIEQGEFTQNLNFDFHLTNLSTTKLYIREIELSVFDQAGKLAFRDFKNPFERESLELNTQSFINPKGIKVLFNPFYSFNKNIPLSDLLYSFTISSEDDKIYYKINCHIYPTIYRTKTKLILPLKGRMLIWDGHDYSSHHRRMDVTTSFFANQGTKGNYMRYGYDFVIVNDSGTMYRGAPKNVTDWYRGKAGDNNDYYSFGVPVYATGDGKIVDAYDGKPDNRNFDYAELATREKAYGGNYIIIDHGNGEYSWFGHLKKGSVKVKIGQTIKQGEMIAEVGASGSSLFPHLHYELRNGSGAKNVEGLPSEFEGFIRVMGAKKINVKKGIVNSGDILESK